jgi:hypothetical protein
MAGWSGYSEKGQGSEERGPGTFTFAPPATPQAQGSNAVMLKAGYQVAQSVGNLSEYNEQGDKTAAALFGFAETMLKPVVQEVAARKFLEGQQRAASGEALTQIVNEQPWYSRIFGPSSAVEGARQYSLDAQAAKFDAAVQQAMPTLRDTNPNELPGIIQKMSKEFQTGDQATDAQLGLRLTKVLPNLIQAHTREYYKAQQERAYNQRFDAAQQNATALQLVSQNAMASEDDKLLRQANFLQGFVLPTGVDPESHKQFIQTSLASMAEAGQLHAVNVAIKNGVTKALSPEKRLQLERSINQFKKRHAMEARDNYAKDFAQIYDRARNDPEYSAAKVMEDYDALNAKYASLSGNDQPLVAGTTRTATAQSALSAYWQRIRQGEALQAKEAAELEKQGKLAEAQELTDSTIKTLFKTNGYAGVKGRPEFKDKDIERVFLQEWDGLRDAEGNADWKARAAMLKHHGAFKGEGVGDVVPTAVKAELARMVNSTGPSLNNNFVQVYGIFRDLTANRQDLAGQAAARAAFGSREFTVLDTFRRETQGKDMTNAGVLAAAHAIARDPLYNPTERFTEKEAPVVDAYLQRELWGKSAKAGESLSGQQKGTWWKFGSTPDKIAPSAQALFKSSMAGHYRMMVNRGVAAEDAMTSASQYALNDVEMLGGYGWSRQGRETDMLTTIKRAYPDKYVDKAMLADAMNSLIAETHKRNSPGELADVQIVMAPDDKDGRQNLIVTARNDDGTYMMPVYINSDMIYQQVLAREKAKVNESKGLEFGPKITYKPAEGAPR